MTTYGAIVGTLGLLVAIAALSWQVFTWRRSRAEPTVVDIGPAIVDGVTAVQIEVRSHSPQPIYVVGAALFVSGAGPGFSMIQLVPGPPGSSIPGVITPNNLGKTSVPLAQLPPLGDFGWSVRAEIWLAHRQDPIGSRRMAWVATNNGGKWEYTQ